MALKRRLPGSLRMNNAVVIVTYNRVELLKECLACVCGQTIPFSRVIVVDNHSTDGTAEFLAAREDLDVIREPENLGGAGGFYDGLQRASQGEYDWVLIIDDDAMIAPDYMEKLLDYANAHTGIYGLAGKVVTEGHIDVSHRRRITNRLLYDFCYREKRCGRLVCPKRDIFFGTMILNIACACRSAVV